ncbi:MAG: MFS transporter [Candidatus Caldatribacteriaceae bacterium]
MPHHWSCHSPLDPRISHESLFGGGNVVRPGNFVPCVGSLFRSSIRLLWEKPFLLMGASFMLLGVSAFALGKNEIHLFTAVGFLGMGVGTLDGRVNGLFMNISGEEKGIGLGVLHMFFGIGVLSGPLLLVLTSTTFHTWRLAFLFIVCLPILFFTLLIPLRLSKAENQKKRPLSEVMGPFQKRFLVQFIFLLLTYVGAEQVIAGWLPTYIINTRGASHNVGSLSLSLFFVGLTSGRLFNGLLSEKIGYSQTLVILSIGSAIFFPLILAAQSVLLVIMLFYSTGYMPFRDLPYRYG